MTKSKLPMPSKAERNQASEAAHFESHQRGKAKGGRVHALDQLHAKLVDEALLYETGSLQDQRDSVANTLLAIESFLVDQGFNLMTLQPLRRPIEALTDREANSLDPLFCERKRGGKPADLLAKQFRQGVMAALADLWLEALKDDPRNQKDKLADAARHISGPPFGKVTRAYLERCRKLASEQAVDEPVRQHAELYREMMQPAADSFGAKQAFYITRDWLRRLPPNNWMSEKLETPHVSTSEDEAG